MHKQHPQTAYRKDAVLIGTIFENCDNKNNPIVFGKLRGAMMYIDFIKNEYPDIPDIDRQAYIDRDKKALISIVQEKIAQNAEEIVERW